MIKVFKYTDFKSGILEFEDFATYRLWSGIFEIADFGTKQWLF
jgi:hypothetical protein